MKNSIADIFIKLPQESRDLIIKRLQSYTQKKEIKKIEGVFTDLIAKIELPKGEKGEPGIIGERGEKGTDGKDGVPGIPGARGKNGNPGKDGKAPIKGVDYFTSKDISEIERSVLKKAAELIRIPELSAEVVKQKLESLKGDKRLSADAIKGLEKYLNVVAMGGGGGGNAALFAELLDTPSSYVGQAGKVASVKADASGLEFTTPSAGVTDHGALTGLEDDDHSQYHNDARGDARYYTQAQIATILADYLTSATASSTYYTETEVDAIVADFITAVAGDARYIRRANDPAKDQGYEQDSSKDGITADYISDKTLHNVALKGHPATKQVGSIWFDTTVTPAVFYAYLNGVNNTIKYDFTTASSELEHTPLSYLIDVWSGNSNQLGNNGLPLVQEYLPSMGANPVPILIDGGDF